MYDAIFNVFRDGTSLEQIMASYQLLVELEKVFACNLSTWLGKP